MVGQWRSAVADVHCEVDNFIVDGDNVAWIVRTTVRTPATASAFPATGKSFETVSANLGRLKDGQAVEHWAEQGMFPFLVQIGVIPAPGQ